MYGIPKFLRADIVDLFLQWFGALVVSDDFCLSRTGESCDKHWVANWIERGVAEVSLSLFAGGNDGSFGAVDWDAREYFLINMRIAAGASICGHILPRYGDGE